MKIWPQVLRASQQERWAMTMFKNSRLVVGVIAATFFMAGAALSQQVSQSEAGASAGRYEAIISQLDEGGDLMVIANVEGALKDVVEKLLGAAAEISGATQKPGAEKAHETLTKLNAFLDKNGFYAIDGFGLSVVPREDGNNSIKYFLGRDSAAAGMPLWRATVGGRSRELASLSFVPDDAVMVRTGTADIPVLWQLIRSAVKEVLSAEASAEFNEGLAAMARTKGIDLDKIMGSLSDEILISAQFSKESTISIPTPEGPKPFPQPSILLGVAVKDGTLPGMLAALISSNTLPHIMTQVSGTTITSINIPGQTPIPMQPSFAMHEGFFLFGSTPQVVASAIKAFDQKTGFVNTPEFKKAFAGLAMVNNGIIYASAEFSEQIREIQMMSMANAPGAEGKAVAKIMTELFGLRPYSTAMVILNKRDGVVFDGTSPYGGKEVVASAMVAPVGIMAAIAIPSFVKARTSAQRNSCVNNLRQIDSAKEQWALEQSLSEGDHVDPVGMAQYIRGNRLPSCPQGGIYTINPVGANPECSIPGHRLR
ncbi:MAG: DUF3352 domain-containing protein [Lentisphaerales bacterium]|jgi:hypothetical protein|nr:MAG: DUF3352 domain-containing protein [Lentisphaerales bacterium]